MMNKEQRLVEEFRMREELYGNDMLDEYFYYEEDPTVESDIELFGYSKFACDAAYEDGEVQWNYIVKNNKILGITAIKKDGDNLKIKFLEINSKLRGRGFGAETIEYFKALKDNKKYKAILLYPKDEEVAEHFYKPLGFKENGGELIY